MGSAEIGPQFLVAEPGPSILLRPFQTPGRQIGRRADAWLILQHVEGHGTDLERETRLRLGRDTDGEDLRSDFPHMRAAPLHDEARGRQRAAELVEILDRHLCHLDRVAAATPCSWDIAHVSAKLRWVAVTMIVACVPTSVEAVMVFSR